MNKQIYIRRGEQRLGPFSLEEVRSKLETGEFKLEEPAWHVGLAGWSSLGAIVQSGAVPAEKGRKHSPAGIGSGVSAGVSLVMGLLLVYLVLHLLPAQAAGSRQVTLMLVGFLAIGLIFISFLGVVLGCISCFSKKREKGWSTLGLVANGLILVTISGCLGFGLFKMANARQRGRVPISSRSTMDDVASRDIKFPTTARTRAQNLEDLRKWYDVKWIKAYETVGRHNPKWDKQALQLINEYANINLGQPQTLSEEGRFQLSRKLLELGCDDPLVMFLCGRSQLELQEGVALRARGVRGLKETKYVPSVGFCMNHELSHFYIQMRDQKGSRDADKAALELLKTIITEKEFSLEETSVLRVCILEGYGAKFFNRNSEAVCQILEKTPGVERWLSLLCQGHYDVDKAWEARGSGYSSTVTAEGWAGFRRHLTAAKAELTESWKLNPKDPAAAATMIKVSMGLNDDPRKEMRLWFDRAVAAEIDNDAAYSSLMYGLRPRWCGSHEDMLEFGRACMRTERYDTRVPRQFLTAVQNIYSELDDDPDEIYRNPDVYKDLKKLLENYLKEPTKTQLKEYYLSHSAIVAYHAGDLNECRSNLEQLKFKYDASTLREWSVSSVPEIGRICALTGPGRVEAEQGETAYSSHKAARALELFTAAEKLSEADARGLEFIRNRKAAIQIEKGLESGNWVNFTPPADLSGWEASIGEWSVKATNLVEVKSGVKGMMMKSLARVGPNFEAKGQIEFVSSTTGDMQAGVTFGYPEMDRKDWESFRIKKTKKEGEVAYFSQHFHLPEKSNLVSVRGTNTFHIQVWHGKMSAYLNGEQIISDYVPYKKDGMVVDEDAEVGLGGYSDQNESVVRYRDVQIRKLKAAPKVPEINLISK